MFYAIKFSTVWKYLNTISSIDKNYFVERKLNSTTLGKVLLKRHKCETKHDKQENSCTHDALWFNAATKLHDHPVCVHI